MRGLQGKVVLITGAGGGIGRALCRRFCEEGSQVVAMDLNEEALKSLPGELGASADKLSCLTLDITDHAAVMRSVALAHQQHGRIDVLVNNAGWDVPMQFLESDPEFWQKVIAINLTGPLNLHHAVLPFMVAAKAGTVVNIASDAGRV